MSNQLWNTQYHQIILSTDPIAYWPQDEKQGVVSYDWVRRRQGSDQDGAYTGVTLGQPGVGDGRTSPLFDGVNDYNDVFTAALQGRFNGSEGTIAIWLRVANAGVWTDGVVRYAFRFVVDAANRLSVRREAVNNRFRWFYNSGGVTKLRDNDAMGAIGTDWFYVAMTWSASADEWRAYLNGVQDGATQNGLGVWVGNPVTILVGAASVAPSNVWNGYGAHPAVWSRPLSPLEVEMLYREAFR